MTRMLESRQPVVAVELVGEWQGRGSMADAESSGLESGGANSPQPAYI